MTSSELSKFLRSLPPQKRRLVDVLRTTIGHVVPDAEESMLWGGISYHRPKVGGRVKGAICLIGTKGDTVRLDFIHGIRLSDPYGILRGNLKSKRYVEIETEAQAESQAIADLIREAASLDPTQWKE